ncbi:MAG: hypothetical protein LBQ12_01535 [Deltaproteobacteria bacterium]|nr:hypothetical protein [Deltaproteobacteria bacterium]
MYGINLWSGFKPDTDYVATFKKGLTDVFGQTLAEDAVVRFRTGPFEPSAAFRRPDGVMESAFPAVLPVNVRNMARVPVFGKVMNDAQTAAFLELWPYGMGDGPVGWMPGEAEPWVEAARRGGGPGGAVLEVKPDADTSKAMATQPVALSELFKGREKDGVIFAGTGASGNNSFGLYQVTDLSLTVKVGSEGSLAWVTRLSDGKGVGEATVVAMDCEGNQLWKGETGSDGLAGFPGGKELSGGAAPTCKSDFSNAKVHFSASKGAERVFWSLGWNTGFYQGMFADFWDPMGGDWTDAFLVSSQPIYKPGETARFKVIARRFTGDAVLPVPAGPARAIIADPEGEAAWEGPIEIGEYGTAAIDWKIPPGSPYGDWKVVLDFDPGEGRSASSLLYPYRASDYAQAGTFRVSFYRAPAFELSLGEMKDAYAGDKVSFSVKGAYHYGAPLDSAEADFELRYEPEWGFSPPGFDSGWNFTARTALEKDSEGGWQSDPVPPGKTAEGSSALSPEGAGSFEAEIPKDGPPVPKLFTLAVTAKDKDSRAVTQSGSFTAHPADVYLGLKPAAYLGEAGKPMKVSVATVAPDGEASPGETAKVSLFRRTWANARRMTPGGYYSLVSELTDTLVSETETRSGGEPVDVELTPLQGGMHYAVAELHDSKGRKAMASCDFWVAGEGASWRTEDEFGVELSADAKEYKPGDTAKILVQSPFSQGTGLLTVERGGLREVRTFDLAGGAPVLEIALGEDDAPSVYASVLLVRGRTAPPPKGGGADLGRPAFRRGYLTLNVLSDRDKLKVEVTPAEAEYRPGDRVNVKVSASDASGAPFSDGEVALVAVDAGLIQIGGDSAFHPEEFLWQALPLRVQTAASLATVLNARNWSEKGGRADAAAPGGGGYEASADGEIRRDFRSVAHFEPALKLNADGEAVTGFTLPDNLTTFRIFAVATGKGRAAGTGEAKLTVTQDLVLRASLPNHLTAGDRFAASAIVTSRAAGEGQLTVSIRPLGGIELLDDGKKTVAVKPGESVEVSFNAKAVKVREAEAEKPAVPGGTGEAGRAAGTDGAAGAVGTDGTDGTGGTGGTDGDGAPASGTPRPGFLSVGFDASLGASADRAEYSVPVGDAGRATTDATFSIAGAGSEMPETKLPEGADPDRGGLELAFSPGVLGLLDVPLAALAAYPYDCLEQSTSKAAGALFELRLNGNAGGGPGATAGGRRAELRDKVAKQVALIASRSMDGGFASWPGADRSSRSPVLTAWVLDFLVEARADGFEVPNSLVSDSAGYLRDELANAAPPPPKDPSADDPRDYSSVKEAPCALCGSDAAQLYVMGAAFRAGLPMEGTLEPFYAKRAALGLPERLFLLRAVEALPPSRVRTSQLMELIPMAASEIEISGVTAQVKDPDGREATHLWITGQNDLTAQALLALSEAAPHHDLLPALVLGAVSAGRGGDFGSTNRAVSVLRGVWNFLEGQKAASGVRPRPALPSPDGTAAEVPAGGGGDGGSAAAEAAAGLNLTIKVLLGEAALVDGKLQGERDPALKVRISSRELAANPPPSWQMAGTGEAWTFQRLTWAPKEPDLSARGTRGLVISRTLQRVKPEPGPAGETKFRRGEVVKVTMTLMTTVPRRNLAVEDPVPAGLEPVDFRLKDQNPFLAELLASNSSFGDPWRAWWSWYDHEEIRPDAILLFADSLEPGVYTYSYLARAVTPGEYTLPGTYAEEMYNPENYGRGAGLKLTVEK